MEVLDIILFALIGGSLLGGILFGPRRFLRPMFGDFEPNELTKFLLLGTIFGLIIGVYWALRPLKDALFQDIVGGIYQPDAKLWSLVVIFPLVMIYSFIVDRLSRKNLFYLMAGVYGTATLIFAYYFYDPIVGLGNPVADPARWIGWMWYWFVESFGSLVIALFWAFATDITSSESAKKGFFLVVALGQVGGALIPRAISRIPLLLGGSNAPAVLICGLLIFLIVPLVAYFLRAVPPSELKGLENTFKKEESGEKQGILTYLWGVFMSFFEGLWLLVTQPYLLGIFGIITFYEIIVTVFDYIFKLRVETEFLDKALKNAYLSDYATWTNLATLLCLLLGINKIQKKLGLTVSLMLMPILVLGAIGIFNFAAQPGSFLADNFLTVMFCLMVFSKAVNYALNSPSQKQLYIPTSDQARYKSQAWIESFGGRGAKAGGSFVNKQHGRMLKALGPDWLDSKFMKLNRFGPLDTVSVWYISSVSLGFVGLIGVWLLVAFFLGRTHKKAVEENRVVC